MQEKINWIDNLKVLGIIAVILGHITSPFGSFIYSWHMPLFFMIAGFFIKFDLTIREFIYRDFKRLMVPYFIFVLMGVVVEVIKRWLLNRDMLDFNQVLMGMMYYMDLESLSGHYGHILWFLPALFFSRILLFLLNEITNNLFLLFILVSILFFISFYVNIPFAIDEALNGVIWVYLGYVYFNYFQKYNSKLFVISVFLIASIFFFYSVPTLDMASKNYENIVINILWASSIFVFLSSVFIKMDFSLKILSVWGGQHYDYIHNACLHK